MGYIKHLLIILSAITTPCVSQTYNWTKKWGGIEDDSGWSVINDNKGNIYVIGIFKDIVDFDPSNVIYTLSSNGGYDSFIVKFDSIGNLKWAKSFGDINDDVICSIALDSSGNIYTAGYYKGNVDFDLSSSNSFYLASTQNSIDIFFTKYDTNGDLFWAKSIGGKMDDFGYNIHYCDNGNLYVSGEFDDTVDFNPNSGIYKLKSNGNKDIFMLKMNSNGNFIWAKNIGGTGTDYLNSSYIDKSENLLLTLRNSQNIDLDPGPDTVLIAKTGYAFSQYDSQGSFKTSNIISSYPYKAFNYNNRIYVCGTFYNSVDFDPSSNSDTLVSIGNNDIFIIEYDTLGNYIQGESIGGSGICEPWIFKEVNQEIYVGGGFNYAIDFDISNNIIADTTNANYDFFIAKYDLSLNYLKSFSGGGNSNDKFYSICIDKNNIYCSGTFELTCDFNPASNGIDTLTSNGKKDAFLTKISMNSVGFNEEFVKNKLLLFPNPTNYLLNIQSNSPLIKCSILNSMGNILIEENNIFTNTHSLNCSHLSSGIYFIKTETITSENSINKIVIIRE